MNANKPTKEEVRAWLLRRRLEQTPPRSPEHIQRELGWRVARSATATTSVSRTSTNN